MAIIHGSPSVTEPLHARDELLARFTRYLDYFQALTEVAKALTGELKVGAVLDTIMQCISQLLKPRDWSLMLLNEETSELRFELVVGEAADKLLGQRLPVGEGIAGWAVTHKQPVIVANVAEDPRFSRRMDELTSFQTASVLCVPLLCRGRVLGVIELVKDVSDPEPYSHEHLEILAPLADFAAIAIDNAHTFRAIEELTVIDEWTSLFNARYLRNTLVDEVARAHRYGRELSVLFFDLDHFKDVNDSYGHAVGSSLLRQVGNFLKHAVRETDRAVRYGGDEFVVIMPETDKLGALALAERVRGNLCATVMREGDAELTITASFGVASFPADADSAQGLLEVADRAMYLSKSRGRNRISDAGSAADV